MEAYIQKLNGYLPVDFNNVGNNEYRKYLVDTYLENCNNGKYQFALMAFHMLFMSFLYREFWGLKTFSFETVRNLCKNNAIFDNINEMFDASIIKEEQTIEHYLGVLKIHINDRDNVKGFVRKRDYCAHASGFVQFRIEGAKRYFEEVLEYADKISEANRKNTVKIFIDEFTEYLTSDYFSTSSTVDTITKKISDMKLSIKNIQYILESSIPETIMQDSMGDFLIAYYFAMITLQNAYESNMEDYELPIERTIFVDGLYLLLETLDKEKFEIIRIQVEDEISFLKSIDCILDLSKIEEILV